MIDRLVIDCLLANQWALHEPVLRSLAAVIGRHAAGHKLSAVQIQQIVHAREPQEHRANSPLGGGDGVRQISAGERWAVDVVQGIAIVPIEGVIAKRARMVNGTSQERGTSCEQISAMLEASVADPGVNGILLSIDSPGGSVAGIGDLGDRIFEIAHGERDGGGEGKGGRPIVAHADDLMASAAYWLGAQCNAIYVNETGYLGSIGVYMVLEDYSRWFEEELKTTVHLVKAGDFKGIGADGVPVTDEQLAELRRNVNATYDIFVDRVGRGLGLDRDRAVAMADGRVHIGGEAVELGFADGVQTIDETLEQMIEEFSAPQALRLAG